MKKATISHSELHSAVQDLVDSIGLLDAARGWLAARGLSEQSLEQEARRLSQVVLALPKEASSAGRGSRSETEVLLLWDDAIFGSPEERLAELRRLAARIPGVEQVGEPKVDSQLHCIWHLPVVYRTSQ